MKEIRLTKGKIALVDDEDYETLMQTSWCYQSPGYAARRRNKRNELMHRVIMKAKKGEQVDHIDMNRLNNQKENLRIVNNSQNGMNKLVQNNSTSGYKGVSWRKERKKWEAYVNKDNKRYRLGYFESKNEAAEAYNKKAIELHGKYATLNEIVEEDDE
ncbi:hypothetical protein B2J90_29600 (plasmid) [Bacillus tropicus]|uniref:HNH endonuclease n=1 Tax=Bacillus tropicus TaxID=2026188 RepID=UPI000A206D81|nr:hypothetical protein B2J90_29600 [Bacillus cereus]